MDGEDASTRADHELETEAQMFGNTLFLLYAIVAFALGGIVVSFFVDDVVVQRIALVCVAVLAVLARVFLAAALRRTHQRRPA